MQILLVPSIQKRLQKIFPEGTEQRTYLVREMSAKVIFVCLYVGAIEDKKTWIRPNQVCRMSEVQSKKIDDESRKAWYEDSLKPKFNPEGDVWFADTTREPIRDESIGEGFIPIRAMIERTGLPTTSPKPRYCLTKDFAKLFDPSLTDEQFLKLAKKWQKKHLSKQALTRQALVASGAAGGDVLIKFPNNETRALSAGPSSVISKAVIEEFAPRFLKTPHVLWLSESGNKVVARDDNMAKKLGIKIDPSKILPDIILVDLGLHNSAKDMLVVFVEVVASDGPINRQRKEAFSQMAENAGFKKAHLAFLTAFMDRSTSQFKKAIVEIAWGSYVWFVSEPDQIIDMRDGSTKKLTDLK